jgi:cytochrome c oxidase subunit 4
MHSSPSDVKKSVRSYMIVFGSLMALTILTVTASSLQVGIALGIVIALVIATIKGSMVAAVFMHLSHEKRWIYGSLLLTLVFFAVLMLVPILTVNDTFGAHRPAITVHEAPAGEPAGH